MKIAIVDDEELQRNQIENLFRHVLKQFYLPDLRIDLYTSGSEFMDQFEQDQYNLVVLDIYMGEDNGVEIARKIREIDNDVTLIFCTTSNEFASESYEVNARYYLHKPISEESVSEMFKRLDPALLMNQRIVVLPDNNRVRLSKLKYSVYENHKVIFYLTSGNEHSVYMSQNDVEDLLKQDDGFYKINRGTIVNFHHVKKLVKKDFQMDDESMLPISRGNFKEISEAYLNYKLKN